MALAEIQALKDLAKEMGIQEGPDLTAFLRDERARAMEERQAENRTRDQQQEAENRATEQQQGPGNRDRDQKQALRLAEIQRETARETADRQDAIQVREKRAGGS